MIQSLLERILGYFTNTTLMFLAIPLVVASKAPMHLVMANCQVITNDSLVMLSKTNQLTILSSKTCIAMVWDEASYRAVIGARAVSLGKTDPEGNVLRYCKASEKTMAISHVWSHGQGGWPEAGLNGCLHHQYASIARSQGCDSYWMDIACIPENH